MLPRAERDKPKSCRQILLLVIGQGGVIAETKEALDLFIQAGGASVSEAFEF